MVHEAVILLLDKERTRRWTESDALLLDTSEQIAVLAI